MEVSMSLNSLVRPPLSKSREYEDGSVRHQLLTSPRTGTAAPARQRRQLLAIQGKGQRGSKARQFHRPPVSLPKIEDDGNPKFAIFIRMANVYQWYPLTIITGGTTAKILGKYLYKDTLSRNLAAVVYRDEKEIQKTAFKQYRVLKTATEFRYGYKLVESNNVRSALGTNDVIELPTADQLKTILDKVKDYFGDAKGSFGKITALNTGNEESSDECKG